MSATVAFVCRGRDGGRLVMVRCDADGCSAEVSYGDRADYVAAGEAGWRRRGDGESAEHLCPEHAT